MNTEIGRRQSEGRDRAIPEGRQDVGDRPLAAQALVRMAECYQKLGDAEAQQIYERLLRDFTDQKDAAAIARARLGRPREIAVHSRGDRAVWTGSKVDLFGRVSPDGRYVTYVDWGLYGNLAFHDIAANNDHLLTRKKNGEDLEGGQGSWNALSPDGKRVAYGWQSTDPGIRIMAVDAGTTPSRGPSEVQRHRGPFSGRSRLVARRHVVGHRPLAKRRHIADRHCVGRRRRVPRLEVDRLARGRPHCVLRKQVRGLRPPGNRAADQRDVFIMAVDGSREIPAVVHMADDLVVGWSPDGRYLLFSSDRTGSTRCGP